MGPARTSGASYPHCHHKNYVSLKILDYTCYQVQIRIAVTPTYSDEPVLLFIFSGLCMQTSVTIYDPNGSCWTEVYNLSHVRVYVTVVCIHNPENINNCQGVSEAAHYCMVLYQQYGLVLVSMCHLES